LKSSVWILILDISENSICEEGCASVSKGITYLKNLKLLGNEFNIDISINKLQKGISLIADALKGKTLIRSLSTYISQFFVTMALGIMVLYP
jgi:hypothetical protein